MAINLKKSILTKLARKKESRDIWGLAKNAYGDNVDTRIKQLLAVDLGLADHNEPGSTGLIASINPTTEARRIAIPQQSAADQIDLLVGSLNKILSVASSFDELATNKAMAMMDINQDQQPNPDEQLLGQVVQLLAAGKGAGGVGAADPFSMDQGVAVPTLPAAAPAAPVQQVQGVSPQQRQAVMNNIAETMPKVLKKTLKTDSVKGWIDQMIVAFNADPLLVDQFYSMI